MELLESFRKFFAVQIFGFVAIASFKCLSVHERKKNF